MGYWAQYSVQKRPLRVLEENGALVKMSKREFSREVDMLYYEEIRMKFEPMSRELLRMYYAVLKSDFEAWDSWNGGTSQTAVAIVSATISAFVSVTFAAIKPSRFFFVNLGTDTVAWIIVGLVSIATFGHLARPIREMARKKARAMFYMTILEEVLAGVDQGLAHRRKTTERSSPISPTK